MSCSTDLSIKSPLFLPPFISSLKTLPLYDPPEEISELIPKKEQAEAATKIQSICRSYLARGELARKQSHYLSQALFEAALPYINSSFPGLSRLPKALNGKTGVYLPKELPIVLKDCGSPQNLHRFEKMQLASKICMQNEYVHLVIPKARIYGDFIIESRLPITLHDFKGQIGLYIENRERFTNAVKEFTGFLCQSNLRDITNKSRENYYYSLSTTPFGRYDNIALYLEDGRGKIGLIDLEEFSSQYPWLQQHSCYSKCLDAIHLFPYHLETILEVAKQFDPDIENYRITLERARDGGLRRFNLTYIEHLEFLKAKRIVFKNPKKFERPSLIRKNELVAILEKEIQKENENTAHFNGNFLGPAPDKTLAKFKDEALLHIVDAGCDFIIELLEKNLRDIGRRQITSLLQLVMLRTVNFTDVEQEIFQKAISSHLKMIPFKFHSLEKRFTDMLIDVIFTELSKSQEISRYIPVLRYADSRVRCIYI